MLILCCIIVSILIALLYVTNNVPVVPNEKTIIIHTGSSIIASTIQLSYGMMTKSTSEVKRWKIRGINLKYSVQRSYLASTSILYMRSYRLTRVVLATNNNLWNWPLWDMRYIIKVVTNLRRRFCEARFENGQKSVF